ncbi:MAG: PKD domain-containing protein [Bacteroidetes bacterium]|nr:PKD domain-containing protein [Bacteroidota bacterium]
MKKQLLLLAGLAMYGAGTLTAQNNQNIIPCWTTEAQQDAFKADPALKQKFELEQSMFELEYQKNVQKLADDANKKVATPVYTVPVVFHILHQYGAENISDQTCIDALAQVNKDYRKLGSDISSINSNFSSLYVDAEIQFMLAHKDPSGNCTTGIIHHYDANTNWNQGTAMSNCSAQHQWTWDHTKYLNIYIVKQIIPQGSSSGGGIIVGYTYNPGGAFCTNADVIVYNYQFLTGLQARSLSHEIGHWFNLIHTFGNTNNPGVSCGSSSGGDGVSDTPDTKGYFSTCPGNNAGPFTGCATVENIENFMDYSSCPRMFTQGQVTRMRTAITSSNQSRNNLWTTTNLTTNTDVYGTGVCAPIADFNANKLKICAGQAVNFSDESSNGTVASWSWTFQGGTPATSTSSVPTVTYTTPGTYSVSMTATNPQGNNTKTKTSYITVVNGTATQTSPYTQNFEAGLPGDWTVVNGNSGSVTWAQASVGANGTSKSMYINSAAGDPAGHIDILESPIFDFKYVTSLNFSYYYAYARKSSTQNDTFKVQYSLDCGGTWLSVLGGADPIATMASNTGGTTSTAFTPTSTQWKQKSVNSSLLSALTGKSNVKIRFWFRNDVSTANANNIYIDEINLSGTVGINELESSIGLNIFPNPTSSSATIEFTLPNTANTAKVYVTDMLGRTLESQTILPETSSVSYTVNKADVLSKGVYLINIEIDGKRITKKLIIE